MRAAAALLAALLAAPAAGQDGDEGDLVLAGNVWALERLGGAPAATDARIAFTTDAAGGSIVRGGGPCNTFHGIYVSETPTGGLFDAGPLAATRRTCPEQAAETAFLAALDAATEARIADGRLVLDGDLRLEFRHAGPAAE